jgi:DNA-binding CsgD family transcriptional regulator
MIRQSRFHRGSNAQRFVDALPVGPWAFPEVHCDQVSEGTAMHGLERYGDRTPNERETRVIELVAQGLKNSEVAEALGTTQHVIKNDLKTIYDKLGLWNRVEVAIWYESRKHHREDLT